MGLIPGLGRSLDQEMATHSSILAWRIPWTEGPTNNKSANIKKSTNNKCWRGCRQNGTLLHCWWECKLIQPLWSTVWRSLKNLRTKLSYDPAIPLLGIHSEEIILEKGICTPIFLHHYLQQLRHGAAQNPLTDEWIRKLWYIYTMDLGKEMATHSSVLAWRIIWMDEPGRLQSMGLH